MASIPSLLSELDTQLTDILNKICVLHNAVYKKREESMIALKAEIDQVKQKLDDMQNSFNAQLQQKTKEAEDIFYVQMTYQQRIRAIENQLSNYYPRSKVDFSTVQKSGKTLVFEDAEIIIHQIADQSVAAMARKALGLYGWQPDNQAAGDLYYRIDAAIKKSEDELRAPIVNNKVLQSSLQAQWDAASKKEHDRLQAKKNQIEALFEKENGAANKKIVQILEDPYTKSKLTRTIKRVNPMIGSKEGWAHYTPAEEVPFEFLLGRGLAPLAPSYFNNYNWLGKDGYGDMRKELGPIVAKNISFYNHTAGGFVIPWTEKRNHNIIFWAETEGKITPAVDYFQDIVLRQLRFMPLKSNRFIYIDPVGLGAHAGKMINLTEAQHGCGACKVVVKPDAISETIGKLAQFVTKVRQTLTAANQVDIYNYNESVAPKKRIPYTTLVIHDFPKGFSAQAIADLRTLTQQSDDCGFTILISHSKDEPLGDAAQKFFDETNEKEVMWRLSFDKDKRCMMYDGSFKAAFKRVPVEPSDDFFEEYNEKYSYKPPVIHALEHFYPLDQPLPETLSARKEFRIPFAVDSDGKLHDITLDMVLKSYAMITGGVGSGKTTLLHTLILGASMHYSPDELEMWLIDYKVAGLGVYATHPLPHIRHLAVDTSSAMSYSIIEELSRENERRKRLFYKASQETGNTISSYSEYCKAGYKLKRIMVIIDEFHRMAEAVSDEPDYKQVLDRLIAEVRTQGITLIICDQEYDKIAKGLTSTGLDKIPVRIAMKHENIQNIRATLASVTKPESLKSKIENLSLSTQPGHLLVKRVVTVDGVGTEQFDLLRCLYADEKADHNILGQMIGRIQKKYDMDSHHMDVYDGPKRWPMDTKAIAQFEQNAPVRADEGERFYVGSPQGIGKCFYFNLRGEESGENILLVGNDNDMRASLIKSIIRNARRQNIRIVLLIPKFSMFYAKNKQLIQEMDDLDCQVITAFGEICTYISEYAAAHKKAFPEDDSEIVLPEETGRTLVICPAIDELYVRMGKQKIKDYPKALTVWQEEIKEWESRQRGIGVGPETAAEPPTEDSVEGSIDSPVEFPGYLTDLEQMITALESDLSDKEGLVSGDSIAPLLAGEDQPPEQRPIFKGYNAIQDLRLLIEEGWKLGMHSMLLTNNTKALKSMQYDIKLNGNFNHRFGLPMTDSEALDFLSSGKAMKIISDSGDMNSAVYEYMGGAVQRFYPYL